MENQLSIYEISNIMERVAIVTMGGKKAHDYGTGKAYTSMEVHTVGYIADHPGCTVTAIAAEWRKTKSAVSQLIKKLKQAGIVRTEADVKDEKQSLLYLTTEGKLLDAKHRMFDEYAWEKSIDGLKESFSEQEINTCFLVLKRWLNIVDTSYENLLSEQKSE